MDKKYRKLLYSSKNDEEKVLKKCIEYALEFSDFGTSDFESDYSYALLSEEGKMLFEIAVQRFGKQLWNSEAWHSEKCKSNCPFGEMCKKEKIQINEKCYCYGQIYLNDITKAKLYNNVDYCYISLVNCNNEIILNLNSCLNNSLKKEQFENFFSEMYWFIIQFGDSRGGKHIIGENIINQLLRND